MFRQRDLARGGDGHGDAVNMGSIDEKENIVRQARDMVSNSSAPVIIGSMTLGAECQQMAKSTLL